MSKVERIMNKPSVNTINPIVGLMEFENIVTIQANDWDEKIIAAQTAITEFLDELKDDQNIVIVATNSVAASKVMKVFQGYEKVIVCNTKENLSALSDLTQTYAVIVVDSGLFKDYTKYLFALKAKEDGSRLVFIL